jgi:hypothetical protein
MEGFPAGPHAAESTISIVPDAVIVCSVWEPAHLPEQSLIGIDGFSCALAVENGGGALRRACHPQHLTPAFFFVKA